MGTLTVMVVTCLLLATSESAPAHKGKKHVAAQARNDAPEPKQVDKEKQEKIEDNSKAETDFGQLPLQKSRSHNSDSTTPTTKPTTQSTTQAPLNKGPFDSNRSPSDSPFPTSPIGAPPNDSNPKEAPMPDLGAQPSNGNKESPPSLPNEAPSKPGSKPLKLKKGSNAAKSKNQEESNTKRHMKSHNHSKSKHGRKSRSIVNEDSHKVSTYKSEEEDEDVETDNDENEIETDVMKSSAEEEEGSAGAKKEEIESSGDH